MTPRKVTDLLLDLLETYHPAMLNKTITGKLELANRPLRSKTRIFANRPRAVENLDIVACFAGWVSDERSDYAMLLL